MGCNYDKENTKCCFDCEYTHCPYMCIGINNKRYEGCDYYVAQKYDCVHEINDNKKRRKICKNI